MSDLQAPIINFQVKAAKSKTGFTPQRALLIGKIGDDGTATDAELISDIQPALVETLLGGKSIAYKAYARFRKFNKSTPIDVFTIKDKKNSTTAKAAEGTLTVTGTCLEDATLRISLGDDGYIIDVPVLTGDTADDVATKIVAIPSTMMTGVVDGTLKSKIKYTMAFEGTSGNGAWVTVPVGALGLKFTGTKFAGGVDDVTPSTAFTNSKVRYQTVIFDKLMPSNKVSDWLDERFNSANIILGGVGFLVDQGSLATLKTKWKAINTKTLTVIANADEMRYSALPLILAAEFAAKRALRMTDGAVLGDLVIEASEAYGGQEKASLPYHNTPMSYLPPSDEISLSDLTSANADGLSFVVPSTTGTVMGSLRTLYKYDGAGVADKTFGFLNAVDTALSVQEYLFNNCKKEFGQTRATHGGLVEGVAMTNVLSVKSFIVGLYEDLVDLALTQGGAEAVKIFKHGLTVTLDSATGFYSVFAPVAIVSQFRGLNGTIAISYDFK